MATWIYAGYALAHATIALTMVWCAWKRGAAGAILVALLATGACYDTLTVSAGSMLGLGTTLKALNFLRFGIEAVYLPTALAAGISMAISAEVGWFQRPIVIRGAIALYVVLMAAGILFFLEHKDIQPACFEGTIRYAASTFPSQFCFDGQVSFPPRAPPVGGLFAILLLIVTGTAVMTVTGWPWMFVGAVATPILAILVPVMQLGIIIGALGGVVLLTCLAASVAHFSSSAAADELEMRKRLDGPGPDKTC